MPKIDKQGAYKLIAPFDGQKIPMRFEVPLDAIEAFERTTGRAILTKGKKVIRYRFNKRKE